VGKLAGPHAVPAVTGQAIEPVDRLAVTLAAGVVGRREQVTRPKAWIVIPDKKEVI